MPANREGGIRKRKQQRRERDGDVIMGAAPRGAAKPSSTATVKSSATGSRGLTELRVTGWTDETEIAKLTKFLERHASKRSAGAKSGGLSANLIRRSTVSGDVLVIKVRPDDVPAFGKLNGFSFPSAHGQQKLSIQGNGAGSKASNTTAAPAPNAHMTEITEALKGFLERRYDPTQKLLNLSNIAADEKVKEMGMFETNSRQSKFIPVLMTIIDQHMKTADAKRDAIHSVTLSNNNLPNLTVVRDVAITLPFIKNLDLSSNKFQSTKDLTSFRNKLKHLDLLVMTNNPIETAQPGWEKEVISWFPRLRILNDVTVRTDTQIARLDAPKHTPMPSSQTIWLDGDKIAQNFLLEFVQGFDNDRNGFLQKYYDAASTFSMCVNARAKGGAGKSHERTPWDSYLPHSRNLKFIHSKKARANRKFRGAEAIAKAWAEIPPTRHAALDTEKFIIDCQPQKDIPDPSGQYSGVTGLTVNLRGEYEEHRTAKGANEIVRRAFDRTFILGPGGLSGVRVVSDMCSLRAAGGVPAWNPLVPNAAPASVPQGAAQAPAPITPPAPVPVEPAPLAGLTAEQEAMVLHVHQATRLTHELAAQCLQTANWNLEAAAQIFNAQKDNLPPEAFVPVV